MDVLIKRNSKTNGCVPAVGDGRERMDIVGFSQIAIMTADRARADAQKEVRDFMNNPASPFFDHSPDE